MESPVLDYVREKIPQFKEVADDTLSQYLYDRQPELLRKDPALYNRVDLTRRAQAGDAELAQTYQPDVIKPLPPPVDIRDVTKGGPPVQIGSMGQAVEYATEAATTPVMSLAEPFTPEEMQGFTRGQKIASGAYNAIAETANFFTSPLGIGTLGIGTLPKVAQRLIAGGFAAHMASQTPELARQLGEELAKPESERDVARISELVTSAGLNTFLTTMAAKHAIGPGAPNFNLGKPEGLPDIDIEAIRSVAPLTAKALDESQLIPREQLQPLAVGKEVSIETPIEKGPENASEISKATEVHGDVQPQPVEGAGQMPANVSGQRVQPQTEGGLQPTPVSEGEVKSPYTPEGVIGQTGPMEAPGLGVNEAKTEPTQPVSTVPPDQAGKELASFGGAVYGEFGETGNPDIYGVRQSTRVERAKAGQVAEVPTGEGIGAEDSVQRGRSILKSDPAAGDKALVQFESDPDQRISADMVAATRARGEQLAKEARRIEEEFGTDSDEYRAAWQALSDWDTRTKPIQTQWHRAGMAQQGETDIDTGSFTGLQRAFKEATGDELRGSPRKKAQKIAKDVRAADQAEVEAKAALNENIKTHTQPEKQPDMTEAEKRAFDAANKTVREAAVRAADAENKARVAEAERKQAIEQVQKDAAQAAQDAANKTVREAAIRRAKEETKQRVAEAKRKGDIARVQEEAAQAAQDAANKTVREAAIRRAKEETKQRVAEAKRKGDIARVQEEAAQAAREASEKTVREAAARRAREENKARVKAADKALKEAEAERRKAQKALDEANARIRQAAIKSAQRARKLQDDPLLRVWTKAREYIDKGVDNFDDLRNQVAADLGMKVGQVTRLLAQDNRTKYLADDFWMKQQQARKLRSNAKAWVYDQAVPLWKRGLAAIPRSMFRLKVGFHGTVALGTHAPYLAFYPKYWAEYARNFTRMYRMVASPKYYEMQVQDLLRRPNYTAAQRAGLVNDPFQYEEFHVNPLVSKLSDLAPKVADWFNKTTGMGNRGYFVLKVLRQDLFDHAWDQLPRAAKIPQVAEAMADGINHLTGVTKGRAPKGSNLILFAPRLWGSRVMWFAGDPIKAADILTHWKTATPGEKYFAINQVKEKAWIFGTMMGMLAVNQGILKATGSKQEINFDDPLRGDWLKFKAAGVNIGYGNAMLNMVRLPARLIQIRESDGGKLKSIVYPDESMASAGFEYVRSQFSPFASLATSLFTKGDWQRRQLPNSTRPMPKRLRQRGVEPYTWPEFWTEAVLPIPMEEAVREVWHSGLGMSPEQVEQTRKAFLTLLIMSGTGARITEDVEATK